MTPQPVKGTRRITLLALLTAIALTIFMIEAQLPVLVPIQGVKLGLANIITVYAVFVLGPGDALLILCARVFLGAVFSGQMMTLLYSMGGGLLADTVKHSHLDEAQTQATALENALRRFRTELCDVQMTARFEMHISDWDRIADFWFDGRLADWNMQSRIHEAQDSVRAVTNDLREALITLYGMQSDTERTCRDAEAAITRLIEG